MKITFRRENCSPEHPECWYDGRGVTENGLLMLLFCYWTFQLCIHACLAEFCPWKTLIHSFTTCMSNAPPLILQGQEWPNPVLGTSVVPCGVSALIWSHTFLKPSWAWRRQSLLWKMCWCCFFVVTSVCFFLLLKYILFSHWLITRTLLALTVETHIPLTAKVNGR